MAKVGDKYIIEIDSITEIDGEKLYKVKGFKSFMFDDYVLDKLQRYEDAKADDEIIVGDEWINSDGVRIVILEDMGDSQYLVMYGNSLTDEMTKECIRRYWHKTGRHFNEIETIIKKLNTIPHKQVDDDFPFDGCSGCKYKSCDKGEFPCSDCYHGNGSDGNESYYEEAR